MSSKIQRRSCPYDLRKRVLINNFLKTQMNVEVENVHPKQKLNTTDQEWVSEPQSSMRKILRSLSYKLRSTCGKKAVQQVKNESRHRYFAVFGSRRSASQESLLSSPEGDTNKHERVSAKSIASKLSINNFQSSWKQRYRPITPSPPAKWTRNRYAVTDSVKKLSKNASPIRHSKRSSKRPAIRKALENFVSASNSEDIVTYPSSVECTISPKTSFMTKMFRNFSVKDSMPSHRTATVNRSCSIHATPNRLPSKPRQPRRSLSMRIRMTKLR